MVISKKKKFISLLNLVSELILNDFSFNKLYFFSPQHKAIKSFNNI